MNIVDSGTLRVRIPQMYGRNENQTLKFFPKIYPTGIAVFF